jgi:hypothetical protein
MKRFKGEQAFPGLKKGESDRKRERLFSKKELKSNGVDQKPIKY